MVAAGHYQTPLAPDHRDVATTMIDTHVLQLGPLGVGITLDPFVTLSLTGSRRSELNRSARIQ